MKASGCKAGQLARVAGPILCTCCGCSNFLFARKPDWVTLDSDVYTNVAGHAFLAALANCLHSGSGSGSLSGATRANIAGQSAVAASASSSSPIRNNGRLEFNSVNECRPFTSRRPADTGRLVGNGTFTDCCHHLLAAKPTKRHSCQLFTGRPEANQTTC